MMNELMSGFADPPLDSARAFRVMLEATAHPGRILRLGVGIDAPRPLLATTAAICLVLCDYDTPVWLAPALSSGSVVDYLRFHTGAPISSDVKAARFLICDPVSAAAALPDADIGSAEYPDRSATLVLQVSEFAAGMPVVLRGPGIEAVQEFRAAGLDRPFWEAVQDNHRLFPLGRDFVFASPDQIAALPRSTDVAIGVHG